MGTRIALGLARALVALFLVPLGAQLVVSPAAAVTPGKTGVLLLGGPQGTTFSGAAPAPVAHAAECDLGAVPAHELWTVGPGGAGLAHVGEGNSGEFSPDGRMLITSSTIPNCSDYENFLSLSRTPFHTQRPIPNGGLIGGSVETFGPWLGPETPTFLQDPSGTFRNGITGHVLVAGSNPQAAMSCSGRVATPDGGIGTPIRVSGRVRVVWRWVPGGAWLGDPTAAGVQWSPDGRYVYFTTQSSSADQLWRVDANGHGRRLLLSTPASEDLTADLSPDGNWFLVSTIGGYIRQLSVMTAGGLGLHSVTFPPATEAMAAGGVWSPRGDLLLVTGIVSTPSMSSSFGYLVRPAGGAPRDLSLPGFQLSNPAVWSPDERFIAYTTGTGDPGTAASLVISPVAGGKSRTILNASVPFPLSPSTFAVDDWQASPGSGHQPPCATGTAPF